MTWGQTQVAARLSPASKSLKIARIVFYNMSAIITRPLIKLTNAYSYIVLMTCYVKNEKEFWLLFYLVFFIWMYSPKRRQFRSYSGGSDGILCQGMEEVDKVNRKTECKNIWEMFQQSQDKKHLKIMIEGETWSWLCCEILQFYQVCNRLEPWSSEQILLEIPTSNFGQIYGRKKKSQEFCH